MSMFRSDRMGYFNILMPREYAWEVLNEIGELNALQFVDQNAHETAFNRPYSNYVKRCEDMEAKLKGIESELNRFNIATEKCYDPKAFLHNQKAFLLSRNRAEKTYFDELEGWLDERLGQLNEQIKNYDSLLDTYNHLVEFREVLVRTRPYIGDSEFRANNEGEGGFDIAENRPDLLARGNIRFGYLAGVIDGEDKERFKKILFRVTRGMAWTVLIDIPKPKGTPSSKDAPQAEVSKAVFLIVYQGGYNDMMKAKLNKVCDSFSASKYGIPEEPSAFNKKLQDIDQQLREAQNVLNITEGQIKSQLNLFAQPRNYTITYSLIEDLRLFIVKEKTIYHNLNTLKAKNSLYQGACWCPLEESDKVKLAINELKRRKSEIGGCDFKDAPFPTDVQPPTHFRLNDVTWIFQEIVNTYGVPRYREINPGLFTIATFPFLFGVMFGDIGHGALLLAFAVYLCWFKEDIEKDKKSLLTLILPGRYLFLFQGICAFYCGLIYNDFMAMPLNLFGSCYDHDLAHGETSYSKHELGCSYAVGLDPSWYGVSNELGFINSFKMKLSIIFGVTQMTFGIILRGNNNFHFNHWLEFIFEFIPMLVFFSLTFGYMAFLILLKWSLPWGTPGYPISDAPSIIGIFIKMALSPGNWSKDMGIPLYGDAEGKYQAELQMTFMIIAVISALLILIPKPLILWIKSMSESSAPAGYAQQHDEPALGEKLLGEEEGHGKEVAASHGGHGGHGGGHHELGEIVVHQVIETIEFVLGAISNTASYLRLWALSLAHSQLAKVFFDNTMGAAIVSGNIFVAFGGFIFLAMTTFAVLLLMDQMECFLHALRLHWVEFQGKFYKADGYKFEPLSFEKTLQESIAN